MVYAIRIVNLYKYLVLQKNEHVLSKQLLRSGTSIGANTRESKNAQSRKDFLTKLSIHSKKLMKQNIGLNSYTRRNILMKISICLYKMTQVN